MDAIEKPNILKILFRGIRRRCPNCGKGPLFRKWVDVLDTCPQCGLKYLRNQGDAWAFQLILDRLFLFLPIVAIYFSFLPENFWHLAGLFGTMILLFIYFTPHRNGFYLAMDFLTRRHWGDPADKLPPPV